MFGWEADVMYDVTAADLAAVTSALFACGATTGIVRRVTENITKSRKDFGVTFSNTDERRSVVVIGVGSTHGEFANSWVHEIYHLARHIAECDGMTGEEPAYVAGEIAGLTFRDAAKRMCECCSKDKR